MCVYMPVYCCVCYIFHTEYIVTFTSYYTTEARDGYLAASLHSYQGWSVVPRSNPGQEYPSDFSLLRLEEEPGEERTEILEALLQHPLIKRVTPQRRITRTLKFTEKGVDFSKLFCLNSGERMEALELFTGQNLHF